MNSNIIYFALLDEDIGVECIRSTCLLVRCTSTICSATAFSRTSEINNFNV